MPTDLVIVKLDKARTLLSEAKTIQDTKKVFEIAFLDDKGKPSERVGRPLRDCHQRVNEGGSKAMCLKPL